MRRCLTTKRGWRRPQSSCLPSPTSENHAICMQEAQSAGQLDLQETASASAATHTSEPLGTGRGEDGYCGGKSDVQEERQRSSSEMIGRTSDSVQCSTARRDGEQSNQAPAQPGARTSPCCEAASWVQGSRPGNPGHPVALRGRSRSLSCFTWAVVRRATPVEAQ